MEEKDNYILHRFCGSFQSSVTPAFLATWESNLLHFELIRILVLCILQAMHEAIGFYKENTEIIMETFNSLGFKVYGGKNAPYVWVYFPGRSSWDVFGEILERTHVVTTPGSGFGPGGEGFIWVSSFGHRENVKEACRRFKEFYK